VAPQYDFPDKGTTMSDVIATLLLRNLQQVFGERDPARRRAAIAELYTEDCTVLLPLGRYVGHTALDQVAGELRAGHPSFVYTPHRAPQAVQDGGCLQWGSGPAGEPPRYTGLDVIIVRENKIAALYVFLDSPPV
jgi:SnoaL-like domain